MEQWSENPDLFKISRTAETEVSQHFELNSVILVNSPNYLTHIFILIKSCCDHDNVICSQISLYNQSTLSSLQMLWSINAAK